MKYACDLRLNLIVLEKLSVTGNTHTTET